MSANRGLLIEELAQLIRTKRIQLVERNIRKGDKSDAAETRYFWNRTDCTGSVSLTIGNLNRFDDEAYKAPFLLAVPAAHKDAESKNGEPASLGALTAIPDATEMAAWKEFYDFYMNAIGDHEHVIKWKKGQKDNKATMATILEAQVAPICLLPEDDDDGLEGKRKRNLCLWQKLNVSSSSPLATKFYVVSFSTNAATGRRCMTRRLVPWSEAQRHMITSRRFASRVELGELKYTQGRWRTMLYVRDVYVEPISERPSSEIYTGDLDIVDAVEEPDAASRVPPPIRVPPPEHIEADDAVHLTRAGAGAGAGAAPALTLSAQEDLSAFDELMRDES